VRDVLPADADLALVGLHEIEHQAHERRLARPIVAYETERLTGLYMQRWDVEAEVRPLPLYEV
jgi:hypothetical protein